MIQKGQAPLLNLVQAPLSVIYWVILASYKAFPFPQQHLSCVGCMPNEGFPKRAKPLFQKPKFRHSCSCQVKNTWLEKVLQFWRKRLCPFGELVYSSSPALVSSWFSQSSPMSSVHVHYRTTENSAVIGETSISHSLLTKWLSAI